MSPIDRRRFLIGAGATAGLLAIGACTSDSGSGGGPATTAAGGTAAGGVLPKPGAAGLIDEALWQERAAGYLEFATTELNPRNVTNVVAHLARARREDDFEWPVEDVTLESLADDLQKIDDWEDTRDFDLMYMLWLLSLGTPEASRTPIAPTVLDAVRERFISNRYRYDDPLPDDRLDELWYWSENHRIICFTIEYLGGQFLPDETFTVTGMTGAEHRDRAKAEILEWVDERARFGFFEWHSNVYMLKNITPLITLIEMADDEEVVDAAVLGLDLSIADVATHLQAGSYAAPRGRTYKKDKMTARDEATFGTAKLLFDDTEHEYSTRSDGGATYLSAAERYRVPQVLCDIATSDEVSVVRERHGILLDGGAPLEENPEAPFGYDFGDTENLEFWWSLGAVGTWQTVDISLEEAEKFRLFDTKLLEQVGLLAAINDNDPEKIKAWVQENHAIVNFGNLSEANTYAWRSPAVSLASVIDHRFGEMRDQAHAWQAQIDADALVFTNHPITPPDESDNWRDDGRPGYWTGEASMPRCAQHERTGIQIYQPAWDADTNELLWSVFGYQPITHAYVPQDRFDSVTQTGNWTIASKGEGHIALWSWREPKWREYDPEVHATNGMEKPFDLVAEGGPDNVWVVEVGTADDGDHDAFVAAVTANDPEVERDDDGFTVAWTSPSSGEVAFGSTAPFIVDGKEVSLGDFPRHESPWGEVDHLDRRFGLSAEGSEMELDFEAMTRKLA